MKINPLFKNKALGAVLMFFGVVGMCLIAYRLCVYHFEYDPEYSPVDYGKYNIISYFTVQSNFFGYIYLILNALAIFGVEKLQKIAFSPLFGALATTYILIAGLVYCAGIPMGFTPPFKWDNAYHFMQSFIQVYYHMIMPVFIVVLWFFPSTNKKIPAKKAWLFGIYPLVYSIFSIIRGAVGAMHYYPYPFYEPSFFWDMFFSGKEMNLLPAYILMIPMLCLGIGLFIAIGLLIITIHNKRIKTYEKA